MTASAQAAERIAIPRTLCLTGTRILLRPARPADVVQRYVDWLNDPDINRYLETRFEVQTINTTSDYVRDAATDRDQVLLAICLREDDRHIGNLKIGRVNWRHRHSDISLFIGEKPLWVHGYAAEAIALACDFAFAVLKLHKLRAGVYADNAGSIRAFEKCGFQREGRLREHVLEDGAYTDVVLLGRLATDKVPAILRR